MAKQLREALDDFDDEDAHDVVRVVFIPVGFYPLEGLGKFDLQVHGSLAVLLGLSETQTAKSPAISGGASGASQGVRLIWVRE